MRFWIFIALVAFACFYLGGEAFLKSQHSFETVAEKVGNQEPEYREEKLHEPWLWIRPRNRAGANSEGLPGSLLPLEKRKREFRVIAIGDASTEGLLDPEHGGYAGRLERNLAGRTQRWKVRVMNAGVSGSDPVFGLELLSRRLLKYKPDLVLITVNSSDIEKLKRRGGLLRFTKSGTLKETPPSWAWFFARSRIARAFFLDVMHYNWDLQSADQSARTEQMAIEDLVKVGAAARDLGIKSRFKVLMVLHPGPGEVASRHLREGLLSVADGYRLSKVEVANLLPDFIDATAPFIPNSTWPYDVSLTPEGHEVFARALELHLRAKRLIPVTPEKPLPLKVRR